jgi:Zn-dependent protease with chaperone function
LEVLRGVDPSLRAPTSFYVLDEMLPDAAVRGRTMVFTRAALECEMLPAIVAHELGHVNTLDGRLTEALVRLVLWEDPLGPVQPAGGEYSPDFGKEGRLLFAFVRWALRFAGGSVPQLLLKPLWAPYWRAREFAADVYAASLGQAPDLARHLTEQELLFDTPRPRTLFDCVARPPVAYRVERLLASSEETGSE